MLGYTPYYHSIIRKMVISFGKLFSDLTIERVDSEKKKAQVIKVPIAYGPKEKWLRRLQENPDLTKQIMMELPRMSFEITNYQYDPERKLGPNTNYLQDLKSRKVSTPIPYNFDVTLYIVTRTQDDMLNIVEQILPFFAPAVTLGVQILDDPIQIIDIPVVLTSVRTEDDYDDGFENPRMIINTLTFTMKGYLFGPIVERKVIKRSIADITQGTSTGSQDSTYTAEVNPFYETNTNADPHTVDEFYINW